MRIREFASSLVLSCVAGFGLPVAGVAGTPAPSLTPPAPTAPSLLKSPGLETVDAGTTNPSDWQCEGRGRYWSVDTTVARSGASSLRWQNTDPGALVRAIQTLDLKPAPGVQYDFGVWVKTQDVVQTRKDARGASIEIRWWNEGRKNLLGWYTGLPDRQGTTDWTWEGVRNATFPPEAKVLQIVCYGAYGSTGTAWFDDVEFHRTIPPLLSTFLLDPAYRGWVTDAGPSAARLRVKLDPDDYGLQLKDLELAVSLDGVKTRPLRLTPRGPVTDVTLPLPKLPPGDYQIVVDLRKKGARDLLGTSRESLRKLAPDFHPAVYIDQYRRVIIGDRPFFPLGMYMGGMDDGIAARYSDSPFNCCLIYGAPDKATMDRAESHHLKVIYALNDFFVTSHSSRAPKTEADEEPAIAVSVAAFKNHPALLAWFLNDELPSYYIPRLKAHCDWVVRDDPGHPTYQVLAAPWTVGLYKETTDGTGCDPYPVPFKPTSDVAAWTREAFKEQEGARPVWMVPQGMNWAHYYTDERAGQSRAPTYAELRSMSWQAITEGATGLIYYTWEEMDKNPGMWDDLRKVAGEIKDDFPALLSILPAPEVMATGAADSTVPRAPTWLHWTVRQQANRIYVFAVNDGDGEGSVTFRIGNLGSADVVVASEKRILHAANGSFTDDFRRLDVHTYVMTTPNAR